MTTATKLPRMKMVGAVVLRCGCEIPIIQDYYREELPPAGEAWTCAEHGEVEVYRSYRRTA